MRQNLLFNMSLTGSMVFILYILSYPFTKRFFSLKWRYRILKIAIAFYLIPTPICKYLIMGVIHRYFPLFWEKTRHLFVHKNRKYIIIASQDSVKLSAGVRYMLVALLLIAVFACVIIQKRIIQYRKWKKVCIIGSDTPANMEQEIFFKIKDEMGIKKKVQLICSEYCNSPMTSGILSTILILPKWAEDINGRDYEYIFRHELVHIKHHDLFIKYMGLFVAAVHWYNPFVYMMLHEISVISEMYCDSIVIGGKGEEERREYGGLILRLAVHNKSADKGHFLIGMAHSRQKRVYKRRILEMKKVRQYKSILPAVMAVLLCMAGCITAFTYDSPYTIFNDVGYDFDADSDYTFEAVEDDADL